MSGTVVRIELDRDAAPVGGRAAGRVTGLPEGAASVVQLLRRVSGAHATEEKVVAEETLTARGGEASFTLDVPAAGPMSYAGKTFSVTWHVRLEAPTVIEADLTVTPAM